MQNHLNRLPLCGSPCCIVACAMSIVATSLAFCSYFPSGKNINNGKTVYDTTYRRHLRHNIDKYKSIRYNENLDYNKNDQG